MPSHRGSSDARPPSLAGPAPRLSLALALLAAGCSSAADLAAGDSNSDAYVEDTGESAGQAGTTGSLTGDTGPAGTTGASDGGEDTGEADAGGEGTSGGEPPQPADDEPAPVDEVEKNVPEEGVCGPDTWMTWRLAAREAGAMVTPAQARELAFKQWPPLSGLPIRPWEFLNYYTFPYPLAAPGELAAGLQLRAGQDDLGDMYELQLAIAGPKLLADDRPPVHLTFALDNSGSMDGKPLLLLRSAVKAISGQLRAGDTVAVATWNDDAAVLLPLTTVKGPYDGQLLGAVDKFVADGSAELVTALDAGYALAKEAYVPTDINRLIVISDGLATATADELEIIAERAADAPSLPGIHVVGVGVGAASMYRGDLIDAIARAGGGPALFVGSEDEAHRQLGERFLSAVGLAALDLEVVLTLPPGLTLASDAHEDIQPAPMLERVLLAPNDRLVMHRALRPCAGPVDPQSVLRVETRWVDGQTGAFKQAMQEFQLGQLLGGEDALLTKGEAVLAYAELLRATQVDPGDDAAWTEAKAALQAALAELPDDPELAEIATVLAALQGT